MLKVLTPEEKLSDVELNELHHFLSQIANFKTSSEVKLTKEDELKIEEISLLASTGKFLNVVFFRFLTLCLRIVKNRFD